MHIFLTILFVLLLVVSLIVSKNNIFSPAVITSAVWLVCLLAFLLLKHKLPPLGGQFLLSIALWVFLLVFFSLLMQSVKFSDTLNYAPSKFVRDLYFWISVFTFPLLLMYAHKAIVLGPTGHWAMDLRLAAVGKTKYFTEIYSGIHITIWQISYLIELFYYSRKNRVRVFVLGFFIISLAFVLMTKTVIMDFFIMTFCILYFKEKVKLKHFLIGLVAIFFVFVVLQSIRHSTDMAGHKNEFVVLYLLSGMSAFDTLTPFTSVHFGENTFRILYAILHSIRISHIEPICVILPWINKPISTNTYTVMYPFFKDFGYIGVAVFAVFYGTLLGWFFNHSQKRNTFFILLYISFITAIVLQFSGEQIFTNIAGRIKYIILLLIPFLATKYRWFIKK